MLQKKFNEENKCLECSLTFNDGNDNQKYKKFYYHLKTVHKMSFEEYYQKHYLNGEVVYCGCGCGIKTKFHKGKFFKYFSNHKNLVKQSPQIIEKNKLSNLKNFKIDNLISKCDLTIEQIEKSYLEFTNLEKSMVMISNELYIDKRTLKSYWKKLNLIKDETIFNRISLKSKTKWFNEAIKPSIEVLTFLENNLSEIKKYVSSKNKTSINEITGVFNLKINKNYLSLYLKDNFNATDLKKIKFYNSSQIEVEFLNVLRFYFGDSIKHSFELDGKIFDYKLGGKILIELDGVYWHSKLRAIKNDLIKNEIAKKNNYCLIRISDKEVKNLAFLNKIKEIYEKLK